jgi:alpha-D-xyloside xylohydrolase
MIWPLLLLLEPAHPQFLPPAYPIWAHKYWIWIDAHRANQSVQLQLLSNYSALNISVGCLNIDSGWSTGYNNFIWNLEKYPDPAGLLSKARQSNVRVIVWATSMVNN